MTEQPKDVWWISRDAEYWIDAGDSREDAIDYGLGEYDGEGFSVGIGVHFPLNPRLLGKSYLGDIIDNANEEAGWEDGLTNEITEQELDDLATTINAAWWAWAARIDLQSRVRGLSVTSQEWIEPTPECLADLAAAEAKAKS